MAIEIYVLSVLRREPVHGYELKRRVNRPSVTPISNNALYPALRRLEEAGAVTKTVESHEGRPSRNVYAITAAGRQQLTDLISTLPREIAGSDEEFLLRVSFFAELPVDVRLAVLGAREDVVRAVLDQVSALLLESPNTPERQWRDRAQRQLVERLEQELRWVDELRTQAVAE